MTYWIEPRHAEESSPIHPTKWEAAEGARLYLDEKKAQRVRTSMCQGDLIFFYETKGNPRDASWRGASAIGALVVVDSPPYFRPDLHSNSKTGEAETWKVDCTWKILVRDWNRGLAIAKICTILGRDPRWRPLTLQRIDDLRGNDLMKALEDCKRLEGSPLP